MSEILDALIKERGWTKKEAARRWGFLDEYQSFVQWTNGVAEPEPDRMVRLAAAIDVDIRELMRVTKYAPLLEGFTRE